jgi:hypothetical protein
VPSALAPGLARRLWPKLRLFLANGTGAFSQTTLCGAEATPNDLEASDANPYAGGGSLYAKAGAVTMLAAPLATPLADYQLRAWFYDSDATTSSHYISPDLADACAVDAAGKRTLADGAPSSLSSSLLLTHPLGFSVFCSSLSHSSLSSV